MVSHTFISTNRKFRRHSSDSEGKLRKFRDKEGGIIKGHHTHSPDTFSSDETSPKLPPLPSYIASPFTPGSAYNVPMDNERVLLECFSAPGSQAPSSVRSAPSIRLTSPDRVDLPHFDDDVFDVLSAAPHKAVHDVPSARKTHEKGMDVVKNEEGVTQKPLSKQVPTLNSVDAADSEDDSDDVFLDHNEPHTKTDPLSCQPSDYRLDKPEPTVKGTKVEIETLSSVHIASSDHLQPKKEVRNLFDCDKSFMESAIHALPVTGNTPSAATVDSKWLSEKEDKVFQRKVPLPCSEKELKLARDLGEKLRAIATAAGFGARRKDGTRFIKNDSGSTVKAELNERDLMEKKQDAVIVISSGSGSERSSLSDDAVILEEPAEKPGKHVRLSSSSDVAECEDVDPALAIERKNSDETLPYGDSDSEEASSQDKPFHAKRSARTPCDSHSSSGPPDLSPAMGSVHSNQSPHNSPPRIVPVDHEDGPRLTRVEENLDEDSVDERRPPEGTDGSLEDRVQDFITHGSQFMAFSIVRSNSLPHLNGGESPLPTPGGHKSPVEEREEADGQEESDRELHTPGSITAHSSSYPGTFMKQSSPREDDKAVTPSYDHSDSPVQSPIASAVQSPAIAAENSNEVNKISELSEETPVDAQSGEFVEQNAEKSVSEEEEDKLLEDNNESKEEGAEENLSLHDEENVLLDSVNFVDGEEICTRSPPDSPRATFDDDDGDAEPMFQWAVPCAAHGSVFCSCEGIDVQSTQDIVPASPRVGNWLCTPGTPAPATPFCDYKLVYSPFPVVGGMTPARPDMTPSRPFMTPRRDFMETPMGSPRQPASPEHDPSAGCGMKRVSDMADEPAAKRRSITPSPSFALTDCNERQSEEKDTNLSACEKEAHTAPEPEEKQKTADEETDLLACGEENVVNATCEKKLLTVDTDSEKATSQINDRLEVNSIPALPVSLSSETTSPSAEEFAHQCHDGHVSDSLPAEPNEPSNSCQVVAECKTSLEKGSRNDLPVVTERTAKESGEKCEGTLKNVKENSLPQSSKDLAQTEQLDSEASLEVKSDKSENKDITAKKPSDTQDVREERLDNGIADSDSSETESVRIISLDDFSESENGPSSLPSEEDNSDQRDRKSSSGSVVSLTNTRATVVDQTIKKHNRTLTLAQYKERKKLHEYHRSESLPASPVCAMREKDLSAVRSAESDSETMLPSHRLRLWERRHSLSPAPHYSDSTASQLKSSTLASETNIVPFVTSDSVTSEITTSAEQNQPSLEEEGNIAQDMKEDDHSGDHSSSVPVSELPLRRCALALRYGMSDSSLPRKTRTESMPTSPSGKAPTLLKRSASFHGHRHVSDTKRAKLEEGE
jgi:hypothetical protein